MVSDDIYILSVNPLIILVCIYWVGRCREETRPVFHTFQFTKSLAPTSTHKYTRLHKIPQRVFVLFCLDLRE